MRPAALLALACLAASAAGQDERPPVEFDRARWVERWRAEARKQGVELTDAEFDKFLTETFVAGVSGVSLAYAEAARQDEARARARAIAALTAIALADESEQEATAALTVLERFAAHPPADHAAASAQFGEIARQLPVGPRRAAAAGAQLRALFRLERFDDARAALAAERTAFGDRATLLSPHDEALRTAEIRAQLAEGRTPPPLAGKALDGTPWTLAGARGDVVVCWFWSRTNQRSVLRLPELRALAARHAADPLRVVGVAVDDDLAALRRFCADWRVDFPQVCEGKGFADPALRAWAMTAVPRLFVIDRRGVIRQVDPAGVELLSATVARLLAEKPEPEPGPEGKGQ